MSKITVTRRQFRVLHRNARRGDYGHEPNMFRSWGFYCIRDHINGGCSFSGDTHNATLHGAIVGVLCHPGKSINPAVRRMMLEHLRKMRSTPVRIP